MFDIRGWCIDCQPAKAVRFLIPSRQFHDNVHQLLFRQPDNGSPQKRTQCEGVATVRQQAGECDHVLNFLPVEKSLSYLSGDRNPKFLQGILINRKFCSSRSEQGDVTRSARNKLFFIPVVNQVTSNKPTAQYRQCACFGFSEYANFPFLIFRLHRIIKGNNTGFCRGVLSPGNQRCESRLTGFFQPVFKLGIHILQYFRE